MSEPAASRKQRLVAMGAALVALVFTLVAVIVVLVRDGGHEAASATSVTSPLRDHDVRATDAVRLQRRDVELVIEKGTTKGLRVKDAALAQALGLEPDDVITAISGKQMTRELDAYDAILKLSMLSATTMYVEIVRKGQPLLLRWRLDGDLRQARYGAAGGGAIGTLGGGTFSGGTLSGLTPPPPPPPPPPDPLLDTIEKLDDTHYKLPRATVDALLANPMQMSGGARVVPSLRNGQPDGFKLYAIRPSSVYAKLGFANGDTIHAVNGHTLDAPDKALEVYTKLRGATSLTFELSRRGQPVDLVIEITK
jgi:type II secretory pathway component PulC